MTTRLRITGMTSVHAARAITTALTMVDGITRVDLTLGGATVEHDGRATPEALRTAIALAGCEVAELVEEPRRLPTV
jgi:copper chaperone CopZ